MSAPSAERARGPRGLALVLVAVVGVLYARTVGHGFLTYDDGSYITENPHVREGLSWDSVRWAFAEFHSANWHPLTWISHQLDVSLFGLAPGPHHLVNAALHALNAVLCLLFLTRATGAPWAAFLAALLFAVHPLRVESVAWAAERKDVLSSAFFFATLLAYERHARAPGARRMLPVIGLFALGLLAKPMLVTLPAVLLLMDVWPLRRWKGSSGPGSRTPRSALVSPSRAPTPDSPSLAPTPDAPSLAPTRPGKTPEVRSGFVLLREKLPLFALALASALVTLLAQRAGGAVRSVDALPLAERLATALVGTATYLRQCVWPSGLAFFYPHPAFVAPDTFSLTAPRVLVSAGVLFALTVAVLAARRRAPALAVGWAWMVVMLLPVIGLVQVGAQLHADRYAYLPTLGLILALVFGAREQPPAWRRPLFALGLAAAAALSVVTWRQVETWRDMRSLCERALDVTQRNYMALEHLGVLEQRAGNLAAAREAYEATLAIAPRLYDAHSNLGAVYLELDQPERAIEHFQRSLALEPDFLDARLNWGLLEERRGQYAAAREQFAAAVQAHPDSAPAWRKLADADLALGQPGSAAESYERSLALAREADTLTGLAWARLEQGRWPEARQDLLATLELAPQQPSATHLLAYLEASARDPRLRDPAAARQRLAGCAARGETGAWLHVRALAALRAAEGDYPEASRLAAEASAEAPRFAWPALKTERETYLAGRALQRP